jgi:hypothetical protein
MTDDDRLGLFFEGGGEPWWPLLAPVIERHHEAETFIGAQRAKSIVPVRELTFQALKPKSSCQVACRGLRSESLPACRVCNRYRDVRQCLCRLAESAVWKGDVDSLHHQGCVHFAAQDREGDVDGRDPKAFDRPRVG